MGILKQKHKKTRVYFQDNMEIDKITADLFKMNEPSTTEELFSSSLYEDIVNIIKERNNTILNRKKVTSFGKCRNCKSDSLSLLEIQTRSADEAKDFFLKCNKCGYTCHAK